MNESTVFTRPVAMVEAVPALVLARVLATRLVRGLTLAQVLTEMGVPPAEREATLEAAAVLEECGERARLARLPRLGNAATSGDEDAASFDVLMDVSRAAMTLRLGQRRTRGLAQSGAIPATKTERGWRFRRQDVLVYAAARRSA